VVLTVLAPLALPWGRAGDSDGPEPLAPLGPPERSNRQAIVTFHYEKTTTEQSDSKGGTKSAIGSNKFNATVRVSIDGQARADVPDLNYLDVHPKTIKTPNGDVTIPMTDTVGLELDYGYADTQPERRADRPQLTSYLRRSNVTGVSDNVHFAMNVWGPPAPKWVHTPLIKIEGSGTEQGHSSAAANRSFAVCDVPARSGGLQRR
jgi:hypothetical protein